MLNLMLRRLSFEVIADCRRDAATSMFGRNSERSKQGVTTMIFDSTYADDGAPDLCYDKCIEKIRDASRWQFGLCKEADNGFSVTGPCRPNHVCHPLKRTVCLGCLGVDLPRRSIDHIARFSVCKYMPLSPSARLRP